MTEERQINLRYCVIDGALLVSNDDHFKHCHSEAVSVSESQFKIIQRERRKGIGHTVNLSGEVKPNV